MELEKRFIKALGKCQIYLEGNRIDKEKVLKLEKTFLNSSIDNERHSSMIFLHTGSICFDAIAFVICLVANMTLDDNNGIKEVQNIEIGDTVYYNGKRWRYDGEVIIDGVIRYSLNDGKKYATTINISKEALSNLIPYKGKAKNLGGIGGKNAKTKRVEFLSKSTGLSQKNFSASSTCTSVLYMERTKLDYLIDNIIIKLEDRPYSVLDLATVTYYTATGEFRYRGNAANNEPDIKVTNTVERAKELVMQSESKEVIGFGAFGSAGYKKYGADIERLLYRRKIRYSWVISKIETSDWITAQIEDSDSKSKLFAVTPNVINSIDITPVESGYLLYRLNKELEHFRERKVKCKIIDSRIVWKDYRSIKNDISFVINNAYGDNDVLQFSRWSYSMLKLFNNALFTMKDYERVQQASQDEKPIDYYNSAVNKFPLLIREKSKRIIQYILDIYEYLYDTNLKLSELKQFLVIEKYKSVLFGLPGIRNIDLYKDALSKAFSKSIVKYSITPESKINEQTLTQYDALIYPALLSFDKYNPFDVNGLKDIYLLIYDSQVRLFKKIERDYNSFIELLDDRSFDFGIVEKREIDRDDALVDEGDLYDGAEADNYIEQDQDLHRQFMSIYIDSEKRMGTYNNGPGAFGMTEAYMYGQFTDGDYVIFTKGFKAYVLNEEEGAVEEKDVDSLVIGQRLLFTINDNKTKDIVDDLLSVFIKKDENIKTAAELIETWKNELRFIKQYKANTYSNMSRLFERAGKNVSGAAIRGWIDLDSHIVGPRDASSYQYIGKVIKNDDLISNPEKYEHASAIIRKLRTDILKIIERVVVADINGVRFTEEGLTEDVIERIRETAVIKRIERIEKIDAFKIQINRTNRPLEA